MVILGLGSNMGDKLNNLRKALCAVKEIPGLIVKQVSPVYLSDALVPDNAPTDWDMPYFNLALNCETDLSPHDLLTQLKSIEWRIGRKPEIRHWGPRIIDIDILAFDDLNIQTETLTVPHLSLQERPFCLWPLADVAPTWKFPLPGINHNKTAAEIVEKWGSRFSGNAPFRTKQINQRIDTPQLIGIVNVTPNSFSDGGDYYNPHQALHHISQLIQSGAEIIDIGAESTAPNASEIDEKTEWERLRPVLIALSEMRAKQKQIIMPKISLDTRKSFVAEKALEMGIVDWINDVSGLDDSRMRKLVMQYQTDCVVMHHTCIPADKNQLLPQDQDNIQLVYAWAEKRLLELQEQGIEKSKIIFDPGIGFGKSSAHSLLLIKHIQVFKKLGVRILVGHSRKSFLSLFTGATFPERDIETLATAIYLTKEHIDYLRVHNVQMCAQGIKLTAALSP